LKRTITSIKVRLTEALKQQLVQWAQQFEEVVWLDSNDYPQEHSSFKAVLAVDAFTGIKTDFNNAFTEFDEYQKITKDWLFGYFSYDLKNDIENLSSKNFDGLGFPNLYFFQPKKVLVFSDDEVTFQYLAMVDDEIESDWKEIQATVFENQDTVKEDIKISLRTSKDNYFEKVNTLLSHIERGDVYEANFCQEFYSENAIIDPVQTFLSLNKISIPPFATFMKLQEYFVLSASPERYLKKTGHKVVSQPIKGTMRRSLVAKEDRELAEKLVNDPKERSENIMITDLVRNDLSRIAEKGTVQVEELCKVYSFEQVHQLISTISCKVASDVSPVTIIKNTFPMGSMTGAPKVRAMELMEELEDAKRGLYSGAVGYFTPSGDFDFNVVIRSILYNATTKYLSFSVGGAITNKSSAEGEYEECLLKAKAMRHVIG
jgi:para-aminobenzoate synthetase component 1